MLKINATLIIQIINIIVFFVIIKVFLYKPLMNIIRSRQDRIIKHLADAEAVRDESDEMKRKYKKKLKEVHAEGAKILKEYSDEGKRIKNEEVQKAKDEAKRILEHTEVEVRHRREKASRDLKNQVSDLAVKISMRVLSDYLNIDEQKDLAMKLAEKVKIHYEG
ncbi:MAG: F0F1 ATP synthase subunit B [Candidatus Eremiobacteraeota bacterium]|nr:F0F1 ATP synthase subunit B [Candidatus Eremiobacteraeota bacterium]